MDFTMAFIKIPRGLWIQWENVGSCLLFLYRHYFNFHRSTCDYWFVIVTDNVTILYIFSPGGKMTQEKIWTICWRWCSESRNVCFLQLNHSTISKTTFSHIHTLLPNPSMILDKPQILVFFSDCFNIGVDASKITKMKLCFGRHLKSL